MGVLRVMNFPDLQRLEIHDILWDIPALKLFQERSACRLTAFVLRQTRVRAGDLIKIFNSFPTLETLIMDKLLPYAVTDTLLMTLAAPALPSLKKIVLTGAYLCSTGNLLTMLESRFEADSGCSILVHIHITLTVRTLQRTDIERFAALPAQSSWLEGTEAGVGPVSIRNGRQLHQ